MQIPLYVANTACLILRSSITASAYELYRARDEEVTEVGWKKAKVSRAERFKMTFSRKNVRVHFVGAWYVVPFLNLSCS